MWGSNHDPEIKSCLLFQLSQPGTPPGYHFRKETLHGLSKLSKVLSLEEVALAFQLTLV